MEQSEIEDIKMTVAEEEKIKVDNAKEEDSLALLGETEGWKILMKKANKKIVTLLEPIKSTDVTSSTDLALVGANTLANSKALQVLREFVNEVESVRKARRFAAEIKSAEGKTE
jgi:hypothetical protein